MLTKTRSFKLPHLALYALLAFAGAAQADTASALETGKAALQDNLIPLSESFATNAIEEAQAATNEVEQAEAVQNLQEAYTLQVAAKERRLSPAEMLEWVSVHTNIPQTIRSYYRARSLNRLGRSEEALPLLTSLADELPEDSQLRLPVLRDQAYTQSALGNTEKGMLLLDEARELDETLTLDLASILLASGNTERVIELLTPYVSQTNSPYRMPAVLLLSRAHHRAQAPEKAKELLTQLLPEDGSAPAPTASDSVNALVQSSLAVLYAEEDDWEKALNAAREGFALAPLQNIRLDCGKTYLRLLILFSENESALTLARELTADAPRSPLVSQAVYEGAVLALEKKASDLAISLCELYFASFQRSERDAVLYAVYAKALSQKEVFKKAADAYLRSAELAQVVGNTNLLQQALYFAAEQQLKSQFYAQAHSTLKRLLQTNPPDDLHASADWLSAETLSYLDPAAAKEAFLQVAEDWKDYPEAVSATFRAAQLSTLPLNSATNELSAATVSTNQAEAMELYQRVSTNAVSSAEAVAAASEESALSENDVSMVIQASAALETALLHQRTGNYSNMLSSLEVAISTPEGGEAVEQASALRPTALLALNRSAEAIAAYNLFTNSYPKSRWLPDVQFWRASHAFSSDDFRLSAELFEDFTKRWESASRTPWALYYAAVSNYRSSNFSKVLENAAALEKYGETAPNLVAVRFVAAEANCQLLAFDEAALLFSEVVNDPKALPELALRALVRKGDCTYTLASSDFARYKESIEAYEGALSFMPHLPPELVLECNYKIGRSYEKSEQTDKALQYFYHKVIIPFEQKPFPGGSVWYARAIYATSDILRQQQNHQEANRLLMRLATSPYPGADEAKRRLNGR